MAAAAGALLFYAPTGILLLATNLVATACFLEYAKLMGGSLRSRSVWLALLFMWMGWGVRSSEYAALYVSLFPLGVMFLWVVHLLRKQDWALARDHLFTLIFGMIYTAMLWSSLAHFILAEARELLFFLLAATFSGDTGAYFVGRALGKHPFFPHISPKKTWEGWFGGVLASGLAGLGVHAVFSLPMTALEAVGIAALLGIAASFGDLAESMLKRSRGVKDSGHWIPGHGGILDRADGLFFSAPLFYFLLKFVLNRL